MRADKIILVWLYILPAILGSTEKNESTFVPTREWQVVKSGMSDEDHGRKSLNLALKNRKYTHIPLGTPIPEGLHVRHDFQTGITEAKLMDSESDEEKSEEDTDQSHTKSLALHPDNPNPATDDSVQLSGKPDPLGYPIDELKARLKKIKQEEIQIIPEPEDESAQEEVKKKFRDYETLKKELKALEINITTDPELMTSYFLKFEPHKSGITMGTLAISEVEEVLDILENLIFLVSYIDNAKVFADMQGMSKIISPCLNGTNDEIKVEALRLLGTAVQSNPKVQMKALENDFVKQLLHILTKSSKPEIKSRCLFALSALVRQFPAAQKIWNDHGGLEIFGKILANDQLNIKIKVMKLINDLLVERQNLQEISDVEQRQQRIKLYAAADIEPKLIAHDYCKHLCDLLAKIYKEELNVDFARENYEFFEIISENMIIVSSTCKSVFTASREYLPLIIDRILFLYRTLELVTEDDEYDIVQNLIVLIEKLRTTITQLPHDEL